MTSQYTRKIFFWILTLLFFVTTVLVVLYAFGYRFSLERGIFIYGGSITVKSNPREVKILLNNQSVSQKKINFINGSYHIDGLRPGNYKLSVEAPDFQTWTKNVSVHSGISTEFWNVLLVRQSYAKTNYNVKLEKRFFISPKGDFIAWAKQDQNEFSVNILEISKKRTQKVFASNEFRFTENENENIEWSPESQAIIVPTMRTSDNQKNYFIINIENEKTTNLKDLTKNEELSDVRWDPQRKNVIYFISQNNLFSIDINNPDSLKKITEKIASYDLSKNYLYYFQTPTGTVYRLALNNLINNKEETEQVTFSPLDDMTDPNYKIVVYNETRIAFINYTNGNLYIWNNGVKNKYLRKLSNEGRGLQFSDDGKKLLFWNPREIFVYFTRDWDVQPIRSENEILEIARYSQEIKNVQWSKEYEHIIFTVENKIKIAELDRRDKCNNFDIIDLENNDESVVVFPADEKLYFTDKSQGDDFFNLFSIDFPEKENLLGL